MTGLLYSFVKGFFGLASQDNPALKLFKTQNECKELDVKEEQRRCPNCDKLNPKGTKFRKEYGSEFGILRCTVCGARVEPGTRFCGGFGARQAENMEAWEGKA